MGVSSDLIARVVRSANTLENQSHVEVSRLINRAIAEVEELRAEAGIIPIPNRDALTHVREVAVQSSQLPKEEWRRALLDAAEMIRDLHILIESGTKFKFVEAAEP